VYDQTADPVPDAAPAWVQPAAEVLTGYTTVPDVVHSAQTVEEEVAGVVVVLVVHSFQAVALVVVVVVVVHGSHSVEALVVVVVVVVHASHSVEAAGVVVVVVVDVHGSHSVAAVVVVALVVVVVVQAPAETEAARPAMMTAERILILVGLFEKDRKGGRFGIKLKRMWVSC